MKIFKDKQTKKDLLFLAPVFLALMAEYPYVFTQFLPLPKLIIILVLLWSYLLYQNKKIHAKSNVYRGIIICMVIQCTVWMLYSIIHADTSYITRIVFIVTTYLIIVTLRKVKLEERFAYYHIKWISIQAILSMLAFVLALIGVLKPFFEFLNLDNRTAYFFGICSTNQLYGNLGRMAGYFDEPGALATWGAFALVYNKAFFNNKTIEYMLLIGLFSTLSLAYFVVLFLYIVLYYGTKIRSLIPILVIALGFVYYFSTQKTDNSKLYELTIERMENTGEGNVGRNELQEIATKYFYKSPIFGNGAKYIDEVDYMNDNPMESFAKDGIFGTFILYLPLIFVMFNSIKRKRVLFACIIMFACYMQRPFHINLMHYVMLYNFCSIAMFNCHLKIKVGCLKNH